MIRHQRQRLEQSSELPFHNLIYSSYSIDFIAQQKAICPHQKVTIGLKIHIHMHLKQFDLQAT